VCALCKYACLVSDMNIRAVRDCVRLVVCVVCALCKYACLVSDMNVRAVRDCVRLVVCVVCALCKYACLVSDMNIRAVRDCVRLGKLRVVLKIADQSCASSHFNSQNTHSQFRNSHFTCALP